MFDKCALNSSHPRSHVFPALKCATAKGATGAGWELAMTCFWEGTGTADADSYLRVKLVFFIDWNDLILIGQKDRMRDSLGLARAE